jgi:hypothetical protein
MLSNWGAYPVERLRPDSETWERGTCYLGSWADTLLRAAYERGEDEAVTADGWRYRYAYDR